MTGERPLAACITGPTATGKTQAAVAVAKALGGEVISMDSMQIYRGFDIGTAKASAQEMQGVTHHLLSYVPPDAAYSAAEYQRDARRAMEEIRTRGKLPIFAGGTGLYLQAVSRPLAFTRAEGSTQVREALQAQAQQPDGPQKLWERLAQVDPERATALHVNNTRRVIRALEVALTTGTPMSAQAGEWDAESQDSWQIFALTMPREMLYERIEARVDQMVRAGLVAEVQALLQSGIRPEAQSMQAIGYKEIVAALQGEISMAEAIEAIGRNTRRYAKRQMTWLRRDGRVQWVDVTACADVASMHAAIIEKIKTHMGEDA